MALSSGNRGGGGAIRDINVTPLVDVMLVLLIVFMVTAPLLTSGLHIDLPEVQASNTPVKDAKLVVSITKDERILFGEDDVTRDIEKALFENPRVQKEHGQAFAIGVKVRLGGNVHPPIISGFVGRVAMLHGLRRRTLAQGGYFVFMRACGKLERFHQRFKTRKRFGSIHGGVSG